MLYTELKVKDTEYKLRLNTRAIIVLEKKLGCNPLNIFAGINQNKIPTVTDMVTILHAALQPYHSNITIEKAYDIFDEWLDDGNIASEFITVILELYKDAGLIKKEKN